MSSENNDQQNHNWQPLQGFSNLENIIVFSVYGLIVGLIAAFLDLKLGTLEIKDLILEPVGIRTFIILSYIGWFTIAIFSFVAAKKEWNIQESKFIRFISLPICRAGISAGVIAIGMTLGVGCGYLIFGKILGTQESINAGLTSIKVSLILSFILMPVILSTSYELFRSVFSRSIQHVASAFFSVVMIYLLIRSYGYENTPLWLPVTIYLALLAILKTVFFFKNRANHRINRMARS